MMRIANEFLDYKFIFIAQKQELFYNTYNVLLTKQEKIHDSKSSSIMNTRHFYLYNSII